MSDSSEEGDWTGVDKRPFLRLLLLVKVFLFFLAFSEVFLVGGLDGGIVSKVYDMLLMYPYRLWFVISENSAKDRLFEIFNNW